MAPPTMKIVFGLLTLVTLGMILGALVQLAFIRRLEDSTGTEFPSFRRRHVSGNFGNLKLTRGFSPWANDKDAITLRIGYVKPEIISWSPRIIVLHNFLSTEECDYLRALAMPRLQVSTVVDSKTGKGIKSDVRTSSGMFLSSKERKYPMIQAIEKRISVYSQIPIENGELIQVLRYEKTQFYKPHHDYFSDTFNLKRGGQRVATMLMYLTDNVEGGETFFPMASATRCYMVLDGVITSECLGRNCLIVKVTTKATLPESVAKAVATNSGGFPRHDIHNRLIMTCSDLGISRSEAGSGECSCGGKMVKGMCVKPNKGDAVLFWSMGLDGQSDPSSIHGGCEVLAGEKWSATKWMRQQSAS